MILSAFCGALRATVDVVRTLSITGHVCEVNTTTYFDSSNEGAYLCAVLGCLCRCDPLMYIRIWGGEAQHTDLCLPVCIAQDEDLLPHAFGLSCDDTSGGRPRTGSQASELTAERMASLSLVEEHLIASGVRGLGFGTAAAGPMPDVAGLVIGNSTAGTEHASTASSASEGAVGVTEGSGVAGIADPVGKVGSDVVTSAVREEGRQAQEEVQSKQILDAFLARLRFRRQLHQVSQPAPESLAIT